MISRAIGRLSDSQRARRHTKRCRSGSSPDVAPAHDPRGGIGNDHKPSSAQHSFVPERDRVLTPAYLASNMSSISSGNRPAAFPSVRPTGQVGQRIGKRVGRSLALQATHGSRIAPRTVQRGPLAAQPPSRRLVRRLQRHDPLGDDTPLGFGNPGRCLEQFDDLGGELHPLDLEKVIEPVERRGETVGKHAGWVATQAVILTRPASAPPQPPKLIT